MSEIDGRSSAEDALRGATVRTWTAPERDAMLTQAYLRAPHTKEDQMTIFNRLFAGKPLVAKLGIATTLLLLIVAAAVLLPRPGAYHALGATEGVVFSYDITSLGEPKPIIEKLRAVKQSFALPEGAELKIMGRIEARHEKRSVKHDGVEGAPQEEQVETAIAAVQLTGGDEATAERLRQAIAAAVPGIGEPQTQNATWFREQGAAKDGGIDINLNFDGKGHVFNFPDGTSEEQIESEINAWLAQNMPGKTFDVDVSVDESGSGEEKRKEIRIKIEGDGHEEK